MDVSSTSSSLTSSERIHVVAGVLIDSRGRILLARRDGDRELAGLWEFPGGKVEAGESPREALARELREEIGVEFDETVPTPLIAVPHLMASGKRILLDVYRITRFQGRARGMESQAITWVQPEKLENYSMPGADRPVVGALRQPDRYLITPEPQEDQLDAHLHQLESALRRGVRRVQWRTRGLKGEALRHALTKAAAIVAQYGGELLLNSATAELDTSLALAKELGIGLHLTSADLMRIEESPRSHFSLLAASCHNEIELKQAQAMSVDFAVLGPVFETATHPEAAPLGLNHFARLRESATMPIYALGGMRVEDISKMRAQGAQGIAAIRSLWPSIA